MVVALVGNLAFRDTQKAMYAMIGLLEGNNVQYGYIYRSEVLSAKEVGLAVDGKFYPANGFFKMRKEKIAEVIRQARESGLAQITE